MSDKHVYRLQRGRQEHEEPARRQGGQPRRDDQHRPAGAARLHDHHRGLQPLLGQRRATRTASKEQVAAALAALEADTGKKFGDAADPLLLVVRSGARASMPGMMDTVLNLGLNDTTVQGVIATTGNAALRLRLLPALRQHVRRRGAAVSSPRTRMSATPSRRSSKRPRRPRASSSTPTWMPTTSRTWSPSSRLPSKSAPATTSPTTRGSSSGAPSPRSSAAGTTTAPWPIAACTTSRTLGHRRQRADHGLRQHRRGVRHGRRLHARPRHRRERVLRRVPRERPGRGRGRRRAHAAAGRASCQQVFPEVYDQLLEVCKTLERDCATCRTSSSRSRRAASSCCRRATASARAWPPSASPWTWCEAGLITPKDALMRVEPEQLNQLLRPIFSPESRRAPSRRAGSWPRACPPAPAPPPASVAFNAADADAWAGRGEEGPAGARRDEPRGHPRHGRVARASSRRAAA